MLESARQQRDSPEQPVQDDRQRVREGLINFFNPVYQLMDQLHEADIRLRGDGALPRPIMSGRAARESLPENAGPFYRVQLDSQTFMQITIATKRGLRYPEIILQAKWRGRVQVNGAEQEQKLTDHFPDMAEWIVGVVTQYEVTTDDPPPLRAEEGSAEHSEAPPTREHRVIMLDDIHEENQ